MASSLATIDEGEEPEEPMPKKGSDLLTKISRIFRASGEMREKKTVYNLILEPKLHQKTSKSKIELRKPYLQI